MEIDLYNPCPVHSDKKIKFCCGKEIVAELNQVVAKFQARQTAAALEALNQLIDRVGERDCLLSFKVQLLAALGEFEKASTTNERFLDRNPEHSLGLEQRAVLLASEGKTEAAYDSLQNAMDHLPGSQIPVNFAGAFNAVATACIQSGSIWAARAHANFAMTLKEDETTQEMLQWIEMASRSLLLKRSTMLKPPPTEELPWKKKYENAMKAERRGQFRKAIQLIEKALEMDPASGFLQKGLALVTSNQPNPEPLVERWRAVGQSADLSLVERVEAEAIAQLYSGAPADQLDIQRVVFEFDVSSDEISTLAHSHSRFVAEEIEPQDVDSGGPPPKASFLFLDRDALDQVGEATFDQIPVILGQCLLYGRQTDRAARLELILAKRDGYDQQLADFQAAFASHLNRIEEEKVGEVPALNDRLEINWHLPRGTSRETYMRLEKAFQFHNAEHVLPELRLEFLGRQTLRELAGTEAGRVAAQAVIAKLELSLDGRPWCSEWGQAVRQNVGLEALPIEALSNLESVDSPFQLLHSNFDAFSTVDLERLFFLCISLGTSSLIQRVGAMLLERQEPLQQLTPELVHFSLARSELDDDRCFEHFAKAKAIAKQANRPFGNVLVGEFEQRLLRGRTRGLRALLQEIEKKHMQERGVGDRLVMMLNKYGLLTQDGRVFLPPEEPAANASTAGGLWTPDAGESPTVSEPGTSGSESKLWIPGQ